MNAICMYWQRAATHGNSLAVYNVAVHPKLPDTVVISSFNEADLRIQEREVIVDAACGAAVLRGAHVFAPGIMGMPTGAIYFSVFLYCWIVKSYNALTDMQLLTFDKFTTNISWLPLCIPAENHLCVLMRACAHAHICS